MYDILMSDPTSTVGECIYDEEIEKRSQESQTSTLHLAVKKDDLNAAQHLIVSGGNVNAVDECGYTALHVATSAGLVEMTKVLLHARADVSIPGGDVAQYALHIAATLGHCVIVRLLLAAGAMVDAVDRNQNTPLHCAAEHGHHLVIEVLLGAGAEIDRVGLKGSTAYL